MILAAAKQDPRAIRHAGKVWLGAIKKVNIFPNTCGIMGHLCTVGVLETDVLITSQYSTCLQC